MSTSKLVKFLNTNMQFMSLGIAESSCALTMKVGTSRTDTEHSAGQFAAETDKFETKC